MMYLALLDMMFFAVTQNDAVPLRAAMMRCLPSCAPMCPQAHIIAEGCIFRRSRHHLPAGQTSFQKNSQVIRLGNFFGTSHRFRYWGLHICLSTKIQIQSPLLYLATRRYNNGFRSVYQYTFHNLGAHVFHPAMQSTLLQYLGALLVLYIVLLFQNQL